MIPVSRRYPTRGWSGMSELLREGHGIMSLNTPDLDWRHFAIDKTAIDREEILRAIECGSRAL